MVFPIKIEASDITPTINMLADRATKGLGKLADALWGKPASDARRHRELQEAQTIKERELIASGGADFVEGELIEYPRHPLLVQHNAYVERQEYDNLAHTLKIVAEKVAKIPDENVSDKPIDRGWFLRWRREVSAISQEELQGLFANLLVEELKNHNAISLRTIDIAKNLTTEDAKNFSNILPYILDCEAVPCDFNIDNIPPEFNYNILINLVDAGLILSVDSFGVTPNRKLIVNGLPVSNCASTKYFLYSYSLKRGSGFNGVALTGAGREILKATDNPKPTNEQMRWVADFLRNSLRCPITVYENDETGFGHEEAVYKAD